MKRILMTVLTASLLATAAHATEVKKGSFDIVVKPYVWVTVQNKATVYNKNDSFAPGDTCLLDRGADVQVIGVKHGKVSATYFAYGPAFGTDCPTGVEFTLPAKDYLATISDAYVYALDDSFATCERYLRRLGKKAGGISYADNPTMVADCARDTTPAIAASMGR